MLAVYIKLEEKTYVANVGRVWVNTREASGGWVELIQAELRNDAVAGVQAEHVASVSEELHDTQKRVSAAYAPDSS